VIDDSVGTFDGSHDVDSPDDNEITSGNAVQVMQLHPEDDLRSGD
jgi:hypothetical protein